MQLCIKRFTGQVCKNSWWMLTVLAVLVWGCSPSERRRPSIDGTTGQDGAVDAFVQPDSTQPPDGTSIDTSIECEAADFPESETQVVFTVPENAFYMHVKAWGAGGNGEHNPGTAGCETGDYGLGGFTEAVFEICSTCVVKPGMDLVVIVGRHGQAGTSGEELMKNGFGYWGSGGLSGVFIHPENPADPNVPITENDQDLALIIAGGGGGASAPGCNPAGPGNHPDYAGGMQTMQGETGPTNGGINSGGGGYKGGEAPTAEDMPGKGGTGFVHDSVPEGSKNLFWAEPGDGVPPRTDDPDYNGDAGQGEQDGWLVIHFVCENIVL